MTADQAPAVRQRSGKVRPGLSKPVQGPEVSVVIATHQGKDRILGTLDSLRNQELPADRFEVIVVVNGHNDDGTRDMLHTQRAFSYPFQLRIITTERASAAHARNLGIAAARAPYLTFVDDDDQVSPSFLKTMLRYAYPDRIVMAPICDVAEPDQPVGNFDNYLNRAALKYAGKEVGFAQLAEVAAANAAKLVATQYARSVSYPTEVSSGEDVVFWSRLVTSARLSVFVLPATADASYRRLVREASVSRKLSRDFAIDRLEVIKILRALTHQYDEYTQPLTKLIGGQTSNLARYLAANPHDRLWVLDQIKQRNIEDFPYDRLNAETTDELLVSYAFPPYSDTSALVVARRLCLSRRPVDVLTQAMDNIREKDEFSVDLVRESVGKTLVVPGSAVFAHWGRISAFVRQGNRLAEDSVTRRSRPYQTIYSRSMWPAAHVMAALYKVRHPEVQWRAEFSDPMRFDSSGNERISVIPEDDEIFTQIETYLHEHGYPGTQSRNMWEWIENLAYALASEVIFTNENQLSYMTAYQQHETLKNRVLSIAQISPHPTLPPEYYEREESSYQLDPSKVNIGYFGVFYQSRGVGDLLEALKNLPASARDRIRLHIFTNDPQKTAKTVRRMRVRDCVVVRPYVPYLEFLALSKRFDWLVVCDARTQDSHTVNPYLPSKYSDYVGSGSRIWSIVESGSVLSRIPADAITFLGDAAGTRQVLENQILTARQVNSGVSGSFVGSSR